MRINLLVPSIALILIGSAVPRTAQSQQIEPIAGCIVPPNFDASYEWLYQDVCNNTLLISKARLLSLHKNDAEVDDADGTIASYLIRYAANCKKAESALQKLLGDQQQLGFDKNLTAKQVTTNMTEVAQNFQKIVKANKVACGK